MANSPVESMQFRFPYSKDGRLDVSVWEGRLKDGKALPSNISLRIQGFEKETVYLGASDALKISAILQHYAVQLLRLDSERRLAAWKDRQEEKTEEKSE